MTDKISISNEAIAGDYSTTRAALESSIQHHSRMAAGAELPGEEPKALQCALCARFNPPGITSPCSGCPVKNRTGKTLCDGTPFFDALLASQSWKSARNYFGPESPHARVAERNFRAAEAREAEFLASLRYDVGEDEDESPEPAIRFVIAGSPDDNGREGNIPLELTRYPCPYGVVQVRARGTYCGVLATFRPEGLHRAGLVNSDLGLPLDDDGRLLLMGEE